MNLFQMTAGPFLAYYLAMYCFCLAWAFFTQARWFQTGHKVDAESLSPLDIAWLAGGARRAADAAVIALNELGAVTVATNGNRVSVVTHPPALPPWLAPFVDCLKSSVATKWIPKRMAVALSSLKTSLVQRGLVATWSGALRLAFLSMAPMAILLVVGVARIVLGHARHHPIGYISMLTILAVASVIGIGVKSTALTAAGRAALRSWRRRSNRVMRAPSTGELAIAFALAGPSVLAGTQLVGYAKIREASNDSGGCGGGGGGGCGGGCGGCGS